MLYIFPVQLIWMITVLQPNVVVGMAFGVGGLTQLLAGMWEFGTGNTFGATGKSC